MSRGVAQKTHRQRCTANVGFLIGLWGQQAARLLQSGITNACTVSSARITDPHTCSWSLWYCKPGSIYCRAWRKAFTLYPYWPYCSPPLWDAPIRGAGTWNWQVWCQKQEVLRPQQPIRGVKLPTAVAAVISHCLSWLADGPLHRPHFPFLSVALMSLGRCHGHGNWKHICD